MKQLLFNPELVEGFFTCFGTRHKNIPDDFD